jgi:hypothetical protein
MLKHPTWSVKQEKSFKKIIKKSDIFKKIWLREHKKNFLFKIYWESSISNQRIHNPCVAQKNVIAKLNRLRSTFKSKYVLKLWVWKHYTKTN